MPTTIPTVNPIFTLASITCGSLMILVMQSKSMNSTTSALITRPVQSIPLDVAPGTAVEDIGTPPLRFTRIVLMRVPACFISTCHKWRRNIFPIRGDGGLFLAQLSGRSFQRRQIIRTDPELDAAEIEF